MPTEEQAEGLINSLMDRIASKEGGASMPVTLVLVGILVIVVSVMGIRLAFAKRKAAELAVKLSRAEEEKARAQENEKLAENSTARQSAREEVAALNVEIGCLKNKMAIRHHGHEEDVKKLRSITSWDDLVVEDKRDS